MRRRKQELSQRLEPAQVQEEQLLEVHRAHSGGVFVCEVAQREGEQVRRNLHAELVQTVLRRAGVQFDGRRGRLGEEVLEQRRRGRDILVEGDAVFC